MERREERGVGGRFLAALIVIVVAPFAHQMAADAALLVLTLACVFECMR